MSTQSDSPQQRAEERKCKAAEERGRGVDRDDYSDRQENEQARSVEKLADDERTKPACFHHKGVEHGYPLVRDDLVFAEMEGDE
jgi:hypothetical protein